jgi:DNA-binding beta-propeller fold protein YncE/phospholipase C
MKLALAVAALCAMSWMLTSQPAPPERVGPRQDGSVLLNTGWMLRPAGRQVPLSTLPMTSVLSKDGKYLLVLHGGYLPPSITVLETKTMSEVSTTPVADAWLGMTLSPNGTMLYVGGGSTATVYEFGFADGTLTPARSFPVVPPADRKWEDFIGDVAMSPDGRLIYAAALYRNEIAIINPQSGMVIEHWKTGRRPYRILFQPDGKSFFVSSWADGSVLQHDTGNGQILTTARLGPHPTDMVWRGRKTIVEEGQEAPSWMARLFVSAANTNKVYVLGFTEARDLTLVETLNVAMTPRQPFGMTPSALALNEDESKLFVVCSDANAVAVADVAGPRGRVLGFIPSGWYPTAARVLPGGQLAILNGRGGRSYPNPGGPNPMKAVERSHLGVRNDQYVGVLQTGTLSLVEPFDDSQLDTLTQTVMRNSPYRDRLLDDASIPAGNPIPSAQGQSSLIEHVVYILKENRTYDQILGDVGKGNSDPSLTLFGERYSPNHHKLAREFVLFDNFYVNADVSADGHNWSSSAIANDYVQKLWPNSYAGRRKHYDYEGSDPATYPPAGYLWTNALAMGLSVRNYGWWVTNLETPGGPGAPQVKEVKDSSLRPYTSMNFRSFDLNYFDTDRVKVYLDDLKRFEAEGRMPRLTLIRIGNDHTAGIAAGKYTPGALMADNDYALGQVVEALSRSRFWPKTAIFVVEDDAQNGPDHVDSHRSPVFVLSPYTRRGVIDSTMYNTTSVLRTMELILGLRPMTQFDAAARPMWAAFSAQPNADPYTAEKPRIDTTSRNPQSSAAVRRTEMDFSEADRADDDELNGEIWTAMRGTPAPAPVRSIFGK